MIESGPRISYTKTLEEQTLVDLSVSPYNLSMMLVWNNLADPHLSPFRDFARFSQTLTLKGPARLFARESEPCILQNREKSHW